MLEICYCYYSYNTSMNRSHIVMVRPLSVFILRRHEKAVFKPLARRCINGRVERRSGHRYFVF